MPSRCKTPASRRKTPLPQRPTQDPQTDVNVIYVQLESFIDPKEITDLGAVRGRGCPPGLGSRRSTPPAT